MIHTEVDRLKLWHKYVKLQLYNELCSNWGKLMDVPTITGGTSAVIACFYIMIRPGDMPTWILLIIYNLGIMIFGLVFWICYQVVLVIRASEDIIRVLTTIEVGQRSHGGMGVTSLALKKYIRIRGKATRPLNYRIGEFNDFTLDVPIGIWDEILNQLLFLLTF